MFKVSKGAKIRNRYNQVPHLTQDTNGIVLPTSGKERSGSVGRELDKGSKYANSRLTGVIVLCPFAIRFICCLVMVKPWKTGIRPNMTKIVDWQVKHQNNQTEQIDLLRAFADQTS